MLARATICAIIENADEVDLAENWLAENKSKLSYVSEMNGCGCCVLSWDVEGPEEVIKLLPEKISASSNWVQGKNK